MLNSHNLYDFCNEVENDGTSVWVYKGNKHLTFVAANSTSIPNFNANLIYVVINCKHNHQVLNDMPFKQF